MNVRNIQPLMRCGAGIGRSLFGNIRRYSSDGSEVIVIPQKIHRSPTDILKALASTIKQDTTAAHYKYHDDPYLIPVSNVGKRTFAMAKESGRKAARWVQAQHPNLFEHRVADPVVQDFLPRAVYNEETAVDESLFQSVIQNAQVSDAITVYQLLEKQGKSISNATKQSFLELLCFYNCEDPLPEDLIEERWFWQSSKGRERQRKTWKYVCNALLGVGDAALCSSMLPTSQAGRILYNLDSKRACTATKDNGLAEAVFNALEERSADAYSALIQGMARYCQVDRAWRLYEESQEKGIVLSAETYNSLIKVVSFLRESTELRWKMIKELLAVLAKQNLQPNIGTLNAVLESISTMVNQKQAKGYALHTLAEFKTLNIEPCLASYYYLLITFCKERGPVSDILTDIMNHIEGKEFSIQDPKDTFFFVTAMDVCRNHLQDKDVAYRVDALLHTGTNYALIGDSYKESIYYRHYFMLVCALEPLDTFMEMYNEIVPHIYIPEPAVMEEVIKVIDMNGAGELFPRIWSDMVVFDHTEREKLVEALLVGMVRNKPPEDSPLVAQFGQVAWDVWKRIEDVDQERYRKWSWTGHMLGDIMVLCLRAGNFQNAVDLMTKLCKSQHTIVGVPPIQSLQLFLEACIAEKDVSKCLMCIQYCSDSAFPEVGDMAKQVTESLTLDSPAVARLSNIVGQEVVADGDGTTKRD